MRLFNHDDSTGVSEYVGVKDGKVTVKTSQEINSILDDNKDDLNASSANWRGDMHHVARIPMLVIEMWRNELKESGAHDTNPLSSNNRKFFISKLNDYNYQRLRTKKGRV